jgi:hypothetical protein
MSGWMDVHYIRCEEGYICWRYGTGGNVEITHIKGAKSGSGRKLLVNMLYELLDQPPYHTVFGFTRIDNSKARAFYERCGFILSNVEGVYKDGLATVFSATFEDLCKLHGVE